MRVSRSRSSALLLLLFVASSLFGASNELPYRPFPPAWQATLDLMVAPVPATSASLPPVPADGWIPGAIVVVRSPAFGVRVGATGYADVAKKTPMGPDLHFRVGSVTKTFTAQLILRLEQEGKLRLTDPISQYIGDNPNVMQIPGIATMTIGQALQMSTGVANYLDNPTIAVSPQMTPDKHYSANDLMAVLGQGYCPPLGPTFAGATASYPNPYWITLNNQAPQPPNYAWWSYSNSNYILLGMVIEKITGQKYADVLEQKLLKPIGLADTYFATNAAVPADMIRGYTHMDAVMSQVLYPAWKDITGINATFAWTAGAIISTPWDLLKYADTIYKTNTILNPGTKEKWLTFVSADTSWAGMQYGAGGLMQGQRIYGDLRGHGGAYPGYKTLMYYFPDSDTTIVLCANTMDQTSESLAPEVMILDSIMPLVKSAVTTPSPANGSQIAGGNTATLKWQPGRVYGTSYQVYVGSDRNAVETATAAGGNVIVVPTTAPMLDVNFLEPNKTYYWRVDTITANQPLQVTTTTPISPFVAATPPTVNGPVWSFQTSTAGK